MTAITAERKEPRQIIHGQPIDPFYSESNMRHLRAVKADAQAGGNMFVHDLIEVDDAKGLA